MTFAKKTSLVHFCSASVLSVAYANGTLAGDISVPGDYPTIQAAINAAANGDTITVAPGVYHEAINFNGKALTVRSTGGPDVTTINATGLNSSTVTIPNTGGAGQLRLHGFSITGGKGTSSGVTRQGGGVYIVGGDTVIEDCLIYGNAADNQGSESSCNGGGLYLNVALCKCVAATFLITLRWVSATEAVAAAFLSAYPAEVPIVLLLTVASPATPRTALAAALEYTELGATSP